MKSLRVMMVMFVLAFLTGGLAQAADMKIGYVDLAKVFDEYNKTKDYDVVLEQQHNKYVQERDTRLQKIKDAQGKLSLLKEEEKGKLQEQMEKDRQDLLQFDSQQQTELKKQRDEKIREILGEIEKVTKDYAEKEKYTLILNDRVLIYGGTDMNLTEQILKILNDGYKK